MIDITEVSEVRPGALSTLGQALAKAQQWEQAETVISVIEKSAPRAQTLRAQTLYVLGIALAKDQQWKQAEAVWTSADKIIGAIKENEERAEALHFVGVLLEGTQQWERIQGMINTIETSPLRASSLHSLGFSFYNMMSLVLLWRKRLFGRYLLEGRCKSLFLGKLLYFKYTNC